MYIAEKAKEIAREKTITCIKALMNNIIIVRTIIFAFGIKI